MRSGSALRVTDQRGRSRGILLSVTEYRRLMERLELMEDSLALRQAKRRAGRLTTHEALTARLRRKGRL